MIHGPTTTGNDQFSVAADTLLLGDVVQLNTSQFLNRIGFYADGLGPIDGIQRLRGALYSEGGQRVAVGQQITIQEDQARDRVWIPFDAALGRALAPGRYRAAIHAGADGDHTRVWTSSIPASGAVVLGSDAPTGPALWVRTDGPGNVTGVFLRTDGAAGSQASNAALFVQPSEPPHPGPYVWIRPDDRGRVLLSTKTGGGGTLDGDAELFVGGDRPPLTFPSVWARQEPITGRLLLDPVAEPAATSPYNLGPPLNVPVDGNVTIPMVLDTTETFRIPEGLSDDYYATLPFDLTQRVFGLTAVSRGSAATAVCGWYGRKFDPTVGAHAIVRQDGPLAGLVGERVRVTRRTSSRTRSVAVYVHDEREFPVELDLQIALTRRAFMALSDLANDEIQTTVEVLT